MSKTTTKPRPKPKTTQARNAQKQSSRRFLYGIIAFVVVGALVIAVASNRNSADKADVATQTAAVTITGDALATYPGQGSADPSVGTTIPDLDGTSLDGKPVTVSDDGKAKVLLFAAHWCPHCQKEIPLLAPDLRENPLPANVEMYTVSTSVNADAPNYPPSEWFEREQWPTTVIADDESNMAAQAYGLDGFPYFVFVNSDNTVAARASGEIPVEQFRAYVNALK
ncbi:MAG TPA: TlpA disulfide reductase family protein [Acidimicrobiia bacterium]|nr:TlpA disulfide reductase family protein [Acidimicrobiia bacterium]